MRQGAFSLAFLNKSRTRDAPTPTNISTNSEPEMLKKGTPASPAIALAKRVLPVPGGPTNNTPLGMRAPTAVKRSGCFKKVTTSCNSSLASSIPATSSNMMSVLASIWKRALDLPKFMACPGPPGKLLERRNKKNNAPIRRMGNNKLPKKPHNAPSLRMGWDSKSTSDRRILLIRSWAYKGRSTRER